MRSSLFALFTLTLAGLISAYDPVKMLCLVNQERAKAGLAPLGLSKALENAAQAHSNDQARMRSMTHTGSDGSSPSTRVSRAGYNWRSVAENVAYGYRDEVECMRQWMNSSGHRQNILGSSYTHFGSAVSNGGGTPYYTQNFASDGSGYNNFPVCPSGATYDTSAGGGNSPSSDYGGGSSPSSGSRPSSNYGGRSPSSGYGGGRSPSSNYGGSRPSSNYGGRSPSSNYGRRPSSNYGGSRPSSNRRTTKPVRSYGGGNVQDSNYTRSGHRHSHGSRNRPTSTTRPTYSSKKPSSYGGSMPSSGSKPSGGAYKTTTTYRKV